MIKLYTSGMVLIAILTNAFAISYSLRLNELHTAQFSMPANDPKVADIVPYSIVEIFDNVERVDLFRIAPSMQGKDDSKNVITYNCEHVLSTLLDDVMFQLNQAGSVTDNTSDVINFVLGKQTIGNWSLGSCDFTRNFQYKWENENLLNALFSIPKPFDAEYQWTWDTTVYPWKLNLIAPSEDINARILYRKNLVGVEKEVDPTYLITRLYGLGYGEGVNQLTIKAVNGGVPYIDSSTIGTYGVIAKIFADKRFESPETLKARMERILEENKVPKITYKVKAADIYKITGEELDKFILGNKVQVDDSETNISFNSRVVSVNKADLIANPGDIELEISNKVDDINNTISNLEVKASVIETYSQGATNIDSNDFQDNCDNNYGALVKFYLSDDVIRLNKARLSYEVDNFRAYSGTTAGGGGTTVSSASGGGQTLAVGNTSAVTADGTYKVGDVLVSSDISVITGNNKTGFIKADGSHNHSVSGSASPSGDTVTGTTNTAGSHKHDMYGHAHFISHEHTVANHTHSVTIPNHTHDIDHGIYEFPHLPPSVIVKVDGNIVPGLTALSGFDIDIVPYLNATGTKINRGEFHTVEIIPQTSVDNPKGLARIYANVVNQVYIQSVGGGDF